jgi:hypothetical protein
MGTTQTTYAMNIAPPPPGTIAGQMDSSKVTTGIAETASPGIPFGRAVSQGALSDAGVIIGGTVAGFRGISVRDVTLKGDRAVLDAYLPPDSVGVLEEGDIWVEPGEAVLAHDVPCASFLPRVFSSRPPAARTPSLCRSATSRRRAASVVGLSSRSPSVARLNR